MSHSHCEDGHHRRHGSGSATRALRWALLVTCVFLVAEFIGGLWTNSLALLADAGHMLTDAAALALSLFAFWFTRKPATAEKTYGYFRVEILVALVNGTALLAIAGAILWEAYERFWSPPEVKSLEMMAIATAGLAANLLCVRLLHGHHHANLNVRGAFLHVLGDVLGSVAAILAGGAMWLWGAYWADPLVSSLVALLICGSAWRLVSDAVRILLEGTPSHVDLDAMQRELTRVPGVESVHHLHVWTLTSGMHAMTCHAVVEPEGRRDLILQRLRAVSRQQFDVRHTTIQLEEEDQCSEHESLCHNGAMSPRAQVSTLQGASRES